MDEFCATFKVVDDGNCTAKVKGTNIEFNAEFFGNLFGVAVKGTYVYFQKERGSYPFSDI